MEDWCPHCKIILNEKDMPFVSDIKKVNNGQYKEVQANWGNLLVLIGLLLHISYGIITSWGIILVGKTCGHIAVSMIFVPLIREIFKTRRYFTHRNIAIALYIGFIMTLLEGTGILKNGTVVAIALLLYLYIVLGNYYRKSAMEEKKKIEELSSKK